MRSVIRDKRIIGSVALLCIVQVLLFARVHSLGRAAPVESTYYALDVGQGDATLIELTDGTRILTDAGPDGSVVGQMKAVLGEERYIDLGIITHLQKDHFYGFLPLLRQYRFGAILWNGRLDAASEKDWKAFTAALHEQRIPLLRIGRGDRIRVGGSDIAILAPAAEYAGSAELNDTSVVQLVRTDTWSALITGDIDAAVEGDLVARYGAQLHADILKVAHHGSKYSSTEAFGEAVQPEIATISVGAHNRYGHPNGDVVARYEANGARVFRTDQQGTVRIGGANDGLSVSAVSPP